MGKYRKLDIILTEEQRSSLEMIVKKGMDSAKDIRRANVILMVDGSLGKGMKDGKQRPYQVHVKKGMLS